MQYSLARLHFYYPRATGLAEMAYPAFKECVYFTLGTKASVSVCSTAGVRAFKFLRILRNSCYLTLAGILTSVVLLMTQMLQCLFGIVLIL